MDGFYFSIDDLMLCFVYVKGPEQVSPDHRSKSVFYDLLQFERCLLTNCCFRLVLFMCLAF